MWSIIRLTDDKCSTGKFNTKTNELLKKFQRTSLLMVQNYAKLAWICTLERRQDTEMHRAQNKSVRKHSKTPTERWTTESKNSWVTFLKQFFIHGHRDLFIQELPSPPLPLPSKCGLHDSYKCGHPDWVYSHFICR